MCFFFSQQTCLSASKTTCMAVLSLGVVVTTQAAQAGSIETADEHLRQCGTQYHQAVLPQVNDKQQQDLYYLCFTGFAVGYSGITKTGIWSAEHLTRQRIETANLLERVDNFHAESRLPNSAKASLNDYQKVHYDRGHLSPNADMATLESQYDSFSLANIVPQNPKNNRGIWRSLESRTRYLALKYGEIYVVTGTAYLGKTNKKINNRVYVPSHLYKAIYVPSLHQAGVYYVPNDDSQRLEVISLNELALRTGIDVMPQLMGDAHTQAMPLPTDDTPMGQTKPSPSDPNTPDLTQLIANILLAILQWLAQLLQK